MSKKEAPFMKIRICISRTFQAEPYYPVKIEAEIVQDEITDYQSAYDAAYAQIEESLIKSEVKLRKLYTVDTNDIDDIEREPKKRKLKRNV